MKHSDNLDQIAPALSALQGNIKNPQNTATNPFFKSKYAPLSDILNLARPLLFEHGLSLIQSPGGSENDVSVTTLIVHKSGQWIESDPLILKPDKVTPQGAGSAITYARRYAVSAMLGISSEDDDDGNHAEKNETKHETKTNIGDTCPSCHAPKGKPHATGCKGVQ